MNALAPATYYITVSYSAKNNETESVVVLDELEGANVPTALMNKKSETVRRSPVPRALRQRVETLLQENYAFMDSEAFRERGIEKQLFDFEIEPALPMTAWYQPTREDVADQLKGTPQLMKTPEE